MVATPAAPSGIKRVSAASGPYAAELSASRPKIGIPAAAPIRSARSSRVGSGFPNRKSVKNIQWSNLGVREAGDTQNSSKGTTAANGGRLGNEMNIQCR